MEAEIERIRRSIGAAEWSAGRRSSRGPTPSFGDRTSVTVDGETDVYLLYVDGPIQVLAPRVQATVGRQVCKIGRTGAFDRRLAELAAGLPPTSAIRYSPVALRSFRSAVRAHSFERKLLDLCDSEGWSLGGEFAYAPLDDLKAAMARRR